MFHEKNKMKMKNEKCKIPPGIFNYENHFQKKIKRKTKGNQKEITGKD